MANADISYITETLEEQRGIAEEDALLLKLLASFVTGMPAELPSAITDAAWNRILHESTMQAVSLMVFDAMGKHKERIPADIYEKAFARSCSCLTSNAKVEYAQSELVNILDRHGAPYVILKGEASAAYYPKPELRNLGDVDFLIDETQKSELEELFINNGYEKSHDGHICHVVFKKPNAHLEMHFEIAGIPNGIQGELVRKYMNDAVHHFKMRKSSMCDFKAPTDMYHGAILIIHMQHHMVGEGLGLRHLCDWACFVNQTYSETFWNESFLPLLKSIGLLKYTSIITKMCSMYLGTHLPEWAEDADESVCKEVMWDILRGGNFGRKDTTRAKSGMFISNHGKNGTKHGKLYYSFYTLNASVKEAHPKLKYIKILYPFFYIEKVVKYLVLMVRGKRPKLRNIFPAANERKRIYDKLHIFEIE